MNIVSMFCFIAKYTGEIIILFVVLRYVLYELVNVHHPVSDIHRSGVAHSGHNQPLVEAQVVDGAEGQGKVGHLLRGQIS